MKYLFDLNIIVRDEDEVIESLTSAFLGSGREEAATTFCFVYLLYAR